MAVFWRKRLAKTIGPPRATERGPGALGRAEGALFAPAFGFDAASLAARPDRLAFAWIHRFPRVANVALRVRRWRPPLCRRHLDEGCRHAQRLQPVSLQAVLGRAGRKQGQGLLRPAYHRTQRAAGLRQLGLDDPIRRPGFPVHQRRRKAQGLEIVPQHRMRPCSRRQFPLRLCGLVDKRGDRPKGFLQVMRRAGDRG